MSVGGNPAGGERMGSRGQGDAVPVEVEQDVDVESAGELVERRAVPLQVVPAAAVVVTGYDTDRPVADGPQRR